MALPVLVEACLSTMAEPCRKLRAVAREWAHAGDEQPGGAALDGESAVLGECARLLELMGAVAYTLAEANGGSWSAAARPKLTYAGTLLEECAGIVHLNAVARLRSPMVSTGTEAGRLVGLLSMVAGDLEFLGRSGESGEWRLDRVYMLLTVLSGVVEAVQTLGRAAARGADPEFGPCMTLRHLERILSRARAALASARSAALWGDEDGASVCPGRVDGSRAMEELQGGLHAVMRTAEAMRVEGESESLRWTGGSHGAFRLLRIVDATRACNALLRTAQVQVERRWGGHGGVHAYAGRAAVVTASSKLDCVSAWVRRSRRPGPERGDPPRTAAFLVAAHAVPKLQQRAAQACGPTVAAMTPAEAGSLLSSVGSALRPMGRVVAGIGAYTSGFAAHVVASLAEDAARDLEYAGRELQAQAGLIRPLSYQPPVGK